MARFCKGDKDPAGQQLCFRRCWADKALLERRYIHIDDFNNCDVRDLRELCGRCRDMGQFVDYWVLPVGTCELVVARLYSFIRWGRVAGLLLGPPKDEGCRTSGKYGDKLQVHKLAAWIVKLKRKGEWAGGGKRVILTKVTAAELGEVKIHLAASGYFPAAELNRLRAFPESISRWGISAGQSDVDALLKNPTAPKHANLELVKRVRAVLTLAGALPPGDPPGGDLAGSGDRAQAYRNTAYPNMRIPQGFSNA